MGCLAILLNLLLPGLGTLLFTNKRIQGFIQVVLAVINYILIVFTLGLWGFFGIFIGLGLFAWAMANTLSFMSEQSAKRIIQQERNRQEG